ncbi:MAG: hypothetical protein JWR83_2364, partial [Aeromicrobium sp.]|nr:hypothetical protein [Aeromicrobium sp.]
LLHELSSEPAHRRDAEGGSIPARTDALAAIQPVDATDEARLAIIRDTIADAMVTYPPLEWFPDIEDAGWQAINSVLRGEIGSAEAAARNTREMQRARRTGAASPKPR